MSSFKAALLVVAIAMISVLSACQSGAQGVPFTSAQQGLDAKQSPNVVYPETLPATQFGAAAALTQQNIAATNADHVTPNILPPLPDLYGCWWEYSTKGSCICWGNPNGGNYCLCFTASTGVQGIAASKNGGPFYIGTTGDTVMAYKYAKGKWTQIGTLTGLSGNPVGMATDSLGDLWVTNSPTTTISEFAKGATTPTKSYTDSNLNSVNYLAVDKKNSVYVEGYSGSSMEIDELTASGTFTTIGKPGQVGTTPGGLALEQHGTTTYMWVNDQGSGSGTGRISRYLLKGASLKSTGSFSYSGIDGAIAADPSGKDIADIYAANNVASGTQFVAGNVAYAFPSGKVVYSWPTSTVPYEDVAIAVMKKL